MRSTSLTIRSVSSQISRVSARSSSPTEVSSSCAAPRMPESGFLISCASIAPSAVTDRAALRWVSCLSIFSAIDRSCSRSVTPPSLIGSGATKASTSRPTPGARRRDVELVAVDGRLGGDRVGDELEHRRAERQEVGEARAQQHARPMSKKCSAAVLTSRIAPRGVDRQHGLGQRVETAATDRAVRRPADDRGRGDSRRRPLRRGVEGARQQRAAPRLGVLGRHQRAAQCGRRAAPFRRRRRDACARGAGPARAHARRATSRDVRARRRAGRRRAARERPAGRQRAARSRRRSQGAPIAARPIMTARAPDAASIARASSRLRQSPLTTTGTRDRVDDLARPRANRPRPGRTGSACAPCTVIMADARRLGAAREFGRVALASSQPSRVFSVTGARTARPPPRGAASPRRDRASARARERARRRAAPGSPC